MALGNLASRFLVALIALPILIAILWLDSPHYSAAVVVIAIGIALNEFYGMVLKDRTERLFGVAAGVFLAALVYGLSNLDGFPVHVAWMLAAFLSMLLPFVFYLFRFQPIETVAQRMAFSIAGNIYVALTFIFLALLKRDFGVHGGWWVVLVLAIAWAGDTGAYFAGRFLGKKKLYPSVSPKKTWAGSIGGILAAVGGAIGVKYILLPELPLVDAVVMGAFGSVIGQIGDLIESLLKRSVGVKDSGNLLPGHGGMLDRIDAVLLIAPFVYHYMMLRAYFA